MNTSSEQNSLFGYENFIRGKQQGVRNGTPVSPKAEPWALIKQLIHDCERMDYDEDESAEMLLDFVRELMSKEHP